MFLIHDDDGDFKIPWEELVSKVEYLFSTCTQKVKIHMLTQETIDRDQGINRREKRELSLYWGRGARFRGAWHLYLYCWRPPYETLIS